MAVARKCDRCGAYTDGESFPMVRTYEEYNPRVVSSEPKTYELCEKCFALVERVLDGESCYLR